MSPGLGQRIAAKRGERLMRERAERAHLADLRRFDSFGPEVFERWQAFLTRQPYHQAWLQSRDRQVGA